MMPCYYQCMRSSQMVICECKLCHGENHGKGIPNKEGDVVEVRRRLAKLLREVKRWDTYSLS